MSFCLRQLRQVFHYSSDPNHSAKPYNIDYKLVKDHTLISTLSKLTASGQ